MGACHMLQCVAVCFCVLLCVAVCCGMLRRVAVCHVKQYIAVRYSVLQCIAVFCSVKLLQYAAVRCSVLRRVAVRCIEARVADSLELARGSCVSSRGEGGGKAQENRSQDSLGPE